MSDIIGAAAEVIYDGTTTNRVADFDDLSPKEGTRYRAIAVKVLRAVRITELDELRGRIRELESTVEHKQSIIEDLEFDARHIREQNYGH